MNGEQTAELAGFKTAGIAVRTTNRDGQSQKDIGLLWGRFMKEGIASRIPNRLSDDIYCLYTAYENGDRGAYDTLIGCRVSSVSDLPGWLRAVEVPALRYRIFESPSDPPDAIISTWIGIWNSGLPRLYGVDFDLYPAVQPGLPGRNILTYVSVKE
jgi:predicted transcriptional regulator YdeE